MRKEPQYVYDSSRESPARAAGKSSVRAGDTVDCRLDGIMAYQSFIETPYAGDRSGLPDGLPRVFDPEKLFRWSSIINQRPTSKRHCAA
jgi:hypothetical protein